MAMAATYFETRGDADERDALAWLEGAGAPDVTASSHQPRFFVETFVPANDKLDTSVALRARQPRSFASTRPEIDCVYMTWRSEPPRHLRPALERLCNKVTRIGHSSSLVQMWVAEERDRPEINWQPGDVAFERQMRVPEPGTFGYLQRVFNHEAVERYQRVAERLEGAKGKERDRLKKEIAEHFPEGAPKTTRPKLTCWQGYARSSSKAIEQRVQGGPFDPNLIVLTKKEEQPALGLETTLQLTSALRDAAMKAAGKDAPEWLTGHQENGNPSVKPHTAFFALPFLGAKHADGHLMGLAIALPRELDLAGETKATVLRRVIGPLLFRDTGEEKTVTLWRGKTWKWELEREKREYPPLTLLSKTWAGPARKWASVTPVVLHHHPKRNRDGDIERILLKAFESARLPAPIQIRVQPVSLFEGAGHARSMPEFTEGGDGLCRYQIHVVVEFPALTQGPVLVGRGRYRGYGLLRPVGVGHD
jgi:CRISPR-associated protein Csb2